MIRRVPSGCKGRRHRKLRFLLVFCDPMLRRARSARLWAFSDSRMGRIAGLYRVSRSRAGQIRTRGGERGVVWAGTYFREFSGTAPSPSRLRPDVSGLQDVSTPRGEPSGRHAEYLTFSLSRPRRMSTRKIQAVFAVSVAGPDSLAAGLATPFSEASGAINPRVRRNSTSICSRTATFPCRNVRTLSRPWPIRSP